MLSQLEQIVADSQQLLLKKCAQKSYYKLEQTEYDQNELKKSSQWWQRILLKEHGVVQFRAAAEQLKNSQQLLHS